MDIPAVRVLFPQLAEVHAAFPPRRAYAARDGPEAQGGDGEPDADVPAHVKVEVVGQEGLWRPHRGVPPVQDAELVEHGI